MRQEWEEAVAMGSFKESNSRGNPSVSTQSLEDSIPETAAVSFRVGIWGDNQDRTGAGLSAPSVPVMPGGPGVQPVRASRTVSPARG